MGKSLKKNSRDNQRDTKMRLSETINHRERAEQLTVVAIDEILVLPEDVRLIAILAYSLRMKYGHKFERKLNADN